ncbi:MAG: Ni/Fe-hydrogenase cytochrome b subunit [candidate division Zixibacteria bacterium]|nr:Ni/Fe-hydrogenase cytochrome b subunit [candidate division Zixibacteria bacterium]
MTNSHEVPTPINVKYFSKGAIVLSFLTLIGLCGYIYRLIVGLDASTNLNNQFPWGIWIAIDVASGVALAAGGFTTALLADVFHKDKYHSLTRPALLTAMLGYTFVVVGLLADLGRYYNVWHPMIPSMWQGNSVLFEVGLCVMIYLNVLYCEFLPILIEKFMGHVNLPGILSRYNSLVESLLRISNRTLYRVLSLFIIAGVVLSCLHQSSLGTLMVIAPYKMHPLWYTPILPLLFLLSAISVGFPMVIFESILSAWSFKLKPETKTLASIAKYTPFLLFCYLSIKLGDLAIRNAFGYLTEINIQSVAFVLEIGIGVILPMVLLFQKSKRHSIKYLFISACCIIFGILVNRINVFLIAYTPPFSNDFYFPSLIEVIVTVGLISGLILIYRFMVIHLPVISVQRVKFNIVTDTPKSKATIKG